MNLNFKKTTILLLLCMGALYTTMAQTVNTTYATQKNNTLSGLDKSKVPHKLLKAQSGLSNKKWDKAIKGLTASKVAKVEKTNENLMVSVL